MTIKKSNQRKRFTLIEILVVMLIILILAGLLIPVIRNVSTKSAVRTTEAQMLTIMTALDEYKEHFGYFPIQEAALWISIKSSPTDASIAAGKPTAWDPPVLDLDEACNWKAIPKYSSTTPSEVLWTGSVRRVFWHYNADERRIYKYWLIDIFEKRFYYQCPGTMNPESYDLWSMGPDSRHGDGAGFVDYDADLHNPDGFAEYDADGNVADAQNRNDNDDITNWKGGFD